MQEFIRTEHIADEFSTIGELLDLVTRRPAWWADAVCREHPDVDFFVETRTGIARAKEVCSRCLAVEDCRAWALEQGPTLYGVFGGLSKVGRAKFKRLQRAA